MREPKPNSLDVIGNAVGLTPQTMREILAEVRANQAKLDACPRHDFEALPGDNAFGLAKKCRCIHCGGIVDRHAWYWHEQGRRA